MNSQHRAPMISSSRLAFLALALTTALCVPSAAAQEKPATTYGDSLVHAYFDEEVRAIESTWLAGIDDLSDWRALEPEKRRELQRMLGLDPMPERTPLHPVVTGTLDHPEFTVEKLHFQSMPGLYVTANLYVPKNADSPLPGVLYVCGHGNRTENGLSLGSKTAYQRHAAWYARHGYVSLIIDTIQLAEIEGVHHGTHRMDRWWWWNRGYTPAGVETWNSIRALDYLASRPEVDAERLAVTGRSGGGGYSWYVAALDERITTTVPTAGITDLRNQVVDGIVRSHCDCMFMINSERWDFPMLAALSAPRPVLLANGDHDPLFPLDGVMRTFHKTRQVYALHDQMENWESLIVDAPHADIPPLRQGTYCWMHEHLKGEELTVNDPAESLFDPVDLTVFDELPEDEINTRIDELFVPAAEPPAVPAAESDWRALRASWMQRLSDETFGGWPDKDDSLGVASVYSAVHDGLRIEAYEFDSQEPYRLRFWIVRSEGDAQPAQLQLRVLDSDSWQEWMAALGGATGDTATVGEIVGPGVDAAPRPEANRQYLAGLRTQVQGGSTGLVLVAPRGVGPTRWTETSTGNGVRRSFMLLGQTQEGMQAWDIRRAVQAVSSVRPGAPIHLEARGTMAATALYAALYEPAITDMQLHALPSTHREGPILLNVRRIFDIPQALALAMDGRSVTVSGAEPGDFTWPQRLAEQPFMNTTSLRFE